MAETYVIAKYDYKAQSNQELNIMKNERLVLLDDSKHWWKVQNTRNQAGFVPSNYVEKEKPSMFDSITKRIFSKKSEPKIAPPSSSRIAAAKEAEAKGISPRVATPADKICLNTTAIVKYTYEAQKADEISLVKGTRVVVMEKSGDGWWKGESCDAQIGWFPSNYVQEEPRDASNVAGVSTPSKKLSVTYQNIPSNEGEHLPEISRNLQPEGEPATVTYQNVLQGNDFVITLYPFSSQSDEELSFQKGDQLEIVERPSNDPDWWRARNNIGQIGLVPKNYLQIVSPGRADTAPPKPDEASVNGAQHEHPKPVLGACGGSPMVKQRNKGNSDRPWYIGSITRSDCDRMLNDFAEDGDFVIRDSETIVGDYSVSLKAPKRNKHFRVYMEDGVYCIGQRRFNSLDELVEYYKRAPIYTGPDGEKLYLIKAFRKVI
ncbi:SH2/SH3 adapter protein dreadlocks [Parasteatoda tepidariorum]|uniref:SH2/SH3 adapter protein dreadlocks n=1 Tax=Parasteatoda tepidariorum TaxID=114398 RepID=UPI001C727C42|nr:cytoplasmic protein NCK2-like [Parasteatoda tepidariorum]